MQFCHSDTTFNFRLKSHAHFSGYDQREQLQAEEMSSLRVESPKWRCVCCWASSGARAPRTRGSVAIPPAAGKAEAVFWSRSLAPPPDPEPRLGRPHAEAGKMRRHTCAHTLCDTGVHAHTACASDPAGRKDKRASRVSLLPYGSPVGISLPPL